MSSIKETIQAGKFLEVSEPGDFFRLLATTGPVDIEFYYQGRETVDMVGVEAGFAEYFKPDGPIGIFDRVRVYSATTQQVQFVTRYGSDVRYDRGASSVTGTIALDAATLLALEQINVRPEVPTTSWTSAAALTANTAIQIVSPGSNGNGLVLLQASACLWSGGISSQALIAKATAPTTVVDGEVLFQIAGASGAYANLAVPQYIAAGLGLYYISLNDYAANASSAPNSRACRYKLL